MRTNMNVMVNVAHRFSDKWNARDLGRRLAFIAELSHGKSEKEQCKKIPGIAGDRRYRHHRAHRKRHGVDHSQN